MCQSGLSQEIKNLSHWHRTLLLRVNLVTGSYMPARMAVFEEARVHGVHTYVVGHMLSSDDIKTLTSSCFNKKQEKYLHLP